MKSLRILRVEGPAREWLDDLVTEEIPLRLLAGPRRLATLLCSPADLEDLVRGFFFTNGLIERGEQIRRVVVNRAGWSAFVELAPEIDPEGLRLPGVVGTACGALYAEDAGSPAGDTAGAAEAAQAPAAGDPTFENRLPTPGQPGWLTPGSLSDLMQEALRASEVHRRTGGVHMAALADASGLLFLREDIGRHNAVDKVIGAQLSAGGDFADKALLASGRLSSELLGKALRCGVPVLASRSAPTDRSVALARRSNLTLVGFARGRRLNVYSAPERLLSGG
ncbi:MAG: formate dehydrogenase accessory sulfurtransferase FdhD [Spirochaetales bacterium]|nr:formate dehydrogenase accessory sulfurtransferase FdhD [Spirochaetales bacterium]